MNMPKSFIDGLRYSIVVLACSALSVSSFAASDPYWDRLVASIKDDLVSNMDAKGQVGRFYNGIGGSVYPDAAFRSFIAKQYGRPKDCHTAEYLWGAMSGTLIAQFGDTDVRRREALDNANEQIAIAYKYMESAARDDPQCKDIPISQHFQRIINSLHQAVADAPKIAIESHRQKVAAEQARIAQAEAQKKAQAEKEAADKAARIAEEQENLKLARERDLKIPPSPGNIPPCQDPSTIRGAKLAIENSYAQVGSPAAPEPFTSPLKYLAEFYSESLYRNFAMDYQLRSTDDVRMCRVLASSAAYITVLIVRNPKNSRELGYKVSNIGLPPQLTIGEGWVNNIR